MIIKSHIRGGYRAAADYLKNVGKNEKIRLVEIGDPAAANLDEAFHNMWVVASNTKAKKPLHHISINPMKGERLTDEQVLKIVARCEQKYGYKPGDHQRVIVEHVLDGRQHFHVMWCRVNLATGKTVWPGEHWKKSKQVCREMEKELGLKRPMPRRVKRILAGYAFANLLPRSLSRYVVSLIRANPLKPYIRPRRRRAPIRAPRLKPAYRPAPRPKRPGPRPRARNMPDSEKMPFRRPEWDTAEHIAWAWDNHRAEVLAQYGIYIDFMPPPGPGYDPAGPEP
ncbi:MAG TPA: relaxase/mobilization nuclease domain-containing protein [Alphaproteobacteria bacterium]|nr:relaxase/mobilization nuclease domain-containing protein [Alphaproteobacteria bacterium]